MNQVLTATSTSSPNPRRALPGGSEPPFFKAIEFRTSRERIKTTSRRIKPHQVTRSANGRKAAPGLFPADPWGCIRTRASSEARRRGGASAAAGWVASALGPPGGIQAPPKGHPGRRRGRARRADVSQECRARARHSGPFDAFWKVRRQRSHASSPSSWTSTRLRTWCATAAPAGSCSCSSWSTRWTQPGLASTGADRAPQARANGRRQGSDLVRSLRAGKISTRRQNTNRDTNTNRTGQRDTCPRSRLGCAPIPCGNRHARLRG